MVKHMDKNNDILIQGAREHNLKNITVAIPRFKLVVITGVSGSGKSSLAFDTLYAEGQRRYVESLSSYARQFLDQMEKPKVDCISGLSPAIAIQQKALSRNPRSTVATVTEIYDYLRVLFANAGTVHCPQCGKKVHAQSAQVIADQISCLPPGTRFLLLAPLVRNRKGAFRDLFSRARSDGFTRLRVDGGQVDLSGKIKLDKRKKHDIDLVVDRLAVPDDRRKKTGFVTRLTDSVETALKAGDGQLILQRPGVKEKLFSEKNACPDCDLSFPKITPAMFSFNSPMGMCPECNGLGTKVEFDPALFVDPEKSLHDGGVKTWRELKKKTKSGTYRIVQQIVEQFGHDLDTPWKRLSKRCRKAILYGGVRVSWKSKSGRASWEGEWDYEGTLNETRRRYKQTQSEYTRKWYASFMSQQICPVCKGRRLRPESASVVIGGKRISQVTAMSIEEAERWIRKAAEEMSPEKLEIAEEVLKEIGERLHFLINVGVHYLTLDRVASSLSGGEGQRIRLASQIGSGLVGVLYVLDEPSIGLHQRDNRRLLDTLEHLRDLGNTVVVVEHDAEAIRTADWIVDLGLGGGVQGGQLVAVGTPKRIENNPKSLTGNYLKGTKEVTSPYERRRPAGERFLSLVGCRQNNLKSITARFPLGLFTCVTGVSGSGKSSLVAQTLYPELAQSLHRMEGVSGEHDRIEGLEHLDKVINITQAPIGRTPRSNPATYVQLLTVIRELFALTPEAKVRGYKPSRFSFNVKGGRCEACSGHGKNKVEMHFLPDVWISCNLCGGSRFNRETLQVEYKGKNIAEVLDMDVDEALLFFSNVPKARHILQTLNDVGLGYVKLGQSATTLSGGEAQRVKLSKELARISTGDTVYILDEPTTGLHFADIQRLLDVLHRLTEAGNTVIVIEHNLDVIKTADWIIDLGPEGGDAGGRIIAEGPPELIAKHAASHTGRVLKKLL